MVPKWKRKTTLTISPPQFGAFPIMVPVCPVCIMIAILHQTISLTFSWLSKQSWINIFFYLCIFGGAASQDPENFNTWIQWVDLILEKHAFKLVPQLLPKITIIIVPWDKSLVNLGPFRPYPPPNATSWEVFVYIIYIYLAEIFPWGFSASLWSGAWELTGQTRCPPLFSWCWPWSLCTSSQTHL